MNRIKKNLIFIVLSFITLKLFGLKFNDKYMIIFVVIPWIVLITSSIIIYLKERQKSE